MEITRVGVDLAKNVFEVHGRRVTRRDEPHSLARNSICPTTPAARLAGAALPVAPRLGVRHGSRPKLTSPEPRLQHCTQQQVR